MSDKELEKRVEEALRQEAREGGIECARAQELARRLGVEMLEVGRAANRLGIKIRACQLGCFA